MRTGTGRPRDRHRCRIDAELQCADALQGAWASSGSRTLILPDPSATTTVSRIAPQRRRHCAAQRHSEYRPDIRRRALSASPARIGRCMQIGIHREQEQPAGSGIHQATQRPQQYTPGVARVWPAHHHAHRIRTIL
jgi:hypothetical protein